MKTTHAYIKIGLLLLVAAMFTTASARADTYSWTNFQSDIAGVARNTARRLVNPWGMAASSDGTIRVSDNGTGVSTLYHQNATGVPRVVTIPAATQATGNPTGIVFNSTPFFQVTKNGNSAPSLFIFVSEDGTISGWNPTLDQTNAIVAVEGSQENIYKGLTMGMANGHNFLYATNFHSGRVDVFNENFHRVFISRFVDPNLPEGYAPFGIRNINDKIYVTYAKQDQAKHDDAPGPGFGLVNVFNTNGDFLRRLISHRELNSPWGLALVDGKLWVGNFGSGIINKYDPNTGAYIETLRRSNGTPLQFDGLWDLLPLGNGVYFTAGIADEAHGLLGLITQDQP